MYTYCATEQLKIADEIDWLTGLYIISAFKLEAERAEIVIVVVVMMVVMR